MTTTQHLPIVLGTTAHGLRVVTRVGRRVRGAAFISKVLDRSDVDYSRPVRTRLRKTTGHTRLDSLVGFRAVHTTFEGHEMIGRLENQGDAHMVIRFSDGRWARADSVIRLVVE